MAKNDARYFSRDYISKDSGLFTYHTRQWFL